MDNKKFILELCDSQITTTIRSSIEKICYEIYPFEEDILNIFQRGK